MITLYVIITLLVIVILLLTYGVFNLIKQNELLEETIVEHLEVFDFVREKVLDTQVQLKEIDIKGSFEADDEVGFVFKNINQLADELTETIESIYEQGN